MIDRCCGNCKMGYSVDGKDWCVLSDDPVEFDDCCDNWQEE